MKKKKITLEQHFQEDQNFQKETTDLFKIQESDHKEFRRGLLEIGDHIKKSNTFMENLSWLSDISKGTQLLKRPSLWIVGFIITLVALMGGLKALLASILGWVTLK